MDGDQCLKLVKRRESTWLYVFVPVYLKEGLAFVQGE